MSNMFKLIVKAIIVSYFGFKFGEFLNKVLDIDATARAVNEDRKKARERAEEASYREAKRLVRKHERKAKKERRMEEEFKLPSNPFGKIWGGKKK